MTMPTPSEARSRQTAYEATEHWWKSRLIALSSQLSALGKRESPSPYVEGFNEACAGAALALDALIAERTK